MIVILRAADRGATHSAGLDSRHAFSFGRYHDPQRMGFGALRVLNEDRLAPGAGFPPHRYANMEILFWVAGGEIDFIEASGHRTRLLAGSLLRVSAGAGVECALINPSLESPAHLIQFWIQPDSLNAASGAAWLSVSDGKRGGGLRLLASRDGRDGSLPLRQDANLCVASFAPGERVMRSFVSDRRAWLQIVHGRIELDDYMLAAGDAAMIEPAGEIVVAADESAEVLLLDLGQGSR